MTGEPHPHDGDDPDRPPLTTLTDGTQVYPEHADIIASGPRAGQQRDYVVLSEAEREKGFVRPVRDSYRHVGRPGPRFPMRDLTDAERAEYAALNGFVKREDYPASESPVTGRYWTQAMLDRVGKGCGGVTTMARSIAETYARTPAFYGGTFCSHCHSHFPVGPDGEFVWVDAPDQRVGT